MKKYIPALILAALIFFFPTYGGLVLLLSVILYGIYAAWTKDTKTALLSVMLITGASLLFSGIHFGIDFSGGTRIPLFFERSLSPQELSDVVNKIKIRTASFGLAEVRVIPVGNDRLYIEVPSTDKTVVEKITKIVSEQGVFVAYIDGERALTGMDIVPGSVSVAPPPPGSDWAVSFMISPEAGQHFSEVAKGKAYYPVYMFLDPPFNKKVYIPPKQLQDLAKKNNMTEEELLRVLEDAVAPLNITIVLNQTANAIPAGEIKLASNPYSPLFYYVEQWPAVGLMSAPLLSPQLASGSKGYSYMISGNVQPGQSSVEEAKRVMSILKGGVLPVKITIGSATTVEPLLGKEFLELSVVALLISLAAVAAIIAFRYRDLKISLPIFLFAVAEMLIILAIVGSFSIDLSSMAGIISFVGTATDAQIILTDEYARTKKHRAGWRTVLINGIVAAIAMIPLLFSGLVEIIGFASATVIGILVGLLITRPAYADFIAGAWHD